MNIVEILKYCPKGTKLYSTVHGEVTLNYICKEKKYPICINIYDQKDSLTKEGRLYEDKGECILFPSENQRSWEDFRLPIKKGDIMMSIDGKSPFIASGKITVSCPEFICGIDEAEHLRISHSNYFWTTKFYIPATEEVKKKLFAAIEKAGYRWNSETLELEQIEKVFKPFDSVLVRNSEDSDWTLSLFASYRKESECDYYVCLNGFRFKYCIPYEGNEHLLGTCEDKQQ